MSLGMTFWALARLMRNQDEREAVERLVPIADKIDVQVADLQTNIGKTLTSIDAFMTAAMDGLSDTEQIEMLNELGSVHQIRDTLSTLSE